MVYIISRIWITEIIRADINPLLDWLWMPWVNLPVVDTIHPESNKFVTDVMIKSTGGSKLNDDLGLTCYFCQLWFFDPNTKLFSPNLPHDWLTTASLKWRLGAWGIQELPLLAATSQMKTPLMAGNPAMSLHTVRGTYTCHTVETVERGREWGVEGNCLGDELPY